MGRFAEWTSATITNLPDSSFAWIDSDGGRHLPYKDADGKPDLPHVRNALARLNQVKGMPESTKSRVQAMLQRILGNQSEIIYTKTPILLTEGSKTSDIEVLRTGIIRDRGLEITEEMIDGYIKNFQDNVYGLFDEAGKPQLPVNFEHNRGSVAVGWIKNVYKKIEDGVTKMFATVDWTSLGVENITKKLFQFCSSELTDDFPHHETGKLFDNVFLGLALTNTPALKGQSPIALSEVEKQVFNNRMLKTLLEEYRKRAFVNKEDKALVAKLLAEAPEDEKKENVAAGAEVAGKPEAPAKTQEELDKEAADKKAADEKAAADAAAAAGKENLTEKQLSIKLAEQNTKIKELTETIEKDKVAKLAETQMVSATKKTGFAGDGTQKELVEFLLPLSEDMRDKFVALVKKITTADLSTKGKNDGEPDEDDLKAADDKEEYVAKCATKLMADGAKGKDGKAMDIEQAQNYAAKEWDEKNKK